MFEIGFSEIVVIMVVALIVIGPEKLPKVARTLGLLWGRAQRYVNGVKADIERDMQLEELRQLKLKMEQEAKSIEQSANEAVNSVDQHIKSLDAPAEIQKAVENKPKSIPAPEPISQQNKATVPVQHQFPID